MANSFEVTIHSDDHFSIVARDDTSDMGQNYGYQIDMTRVDTGQTWNVVLLDMEGKDVVLPSLYAVPSIIDALKWAYEFLVRVVHEEDEIMWPKTTLVLENM